MMSSKHVPIPKLQKPLKSLSVRRRMTIALGALCAGGLIIAADTAIIADDGSKTYGLKVHQGMSKTGCYVIASATQDGNAAKTLTIQILDELEEQDPKTLARVEKIVQE